MRKLFLLLLFVVVSCAPTYRMVYNSYLTQSNNKSLSFEDSRFAFSFTLWPNGIFFTVKNKQDSTGYILWKDSYFINPDGNSYQALNTDVLNIDEKIMYRYDNKSPIAPLSNLTRFTTASNNVSSYVEYSTVAINKKFGNKSTKSSVLSKNSFFSTGAYRTREISTGSSRILKRRLAKLSEDTKKYNSLGMGLKIRIGKSLYRYKFNFKV